MQIQQKIIKLLAILILLASPKMLVVAAGIPGATNLEVSLHVKGKKATDTWINISSNGQQIEIPGAPVLFSLRKILQPSTILALEGRMDANGLFSNKVLATFGIDLTFNGPLRVVNLEINPLPLPPPLPPQPKVIAPKSIRGQEKALVDSGPWASPVVPALRGQQEDKNPKESKPNIDLDFDQARLDTNKILNQNEVSIKLDSTEKIPKPIMHKVNQATEVVTYEFDRTPDELFEDVFKRKPPALPTTVEVTLLVDGKSFGTLWILYNEKLKRYTFPVDPVLNALQGLVKQELWEKLEQQARNKTRFTVEDLLDCGFPTQLNTSVFELSTGIPAQLAGTKIHPLSGQILDPYSVPAYEQNNFTGYFNTRLQQKISYLQYSPNPFDSSGFGRVQVRNGNSQPRDPMLIELDFGINLTGWVVEGTGLILESKSGQPIQFHRQNFRLVHDWPKKAVRLNIGDLIFPTSGYLSFQNLGGIGLSRDYSLQPHLVAYPVKELEFFLNNPAEVKIYINDVLKGTYQFEAGTHDLRGFPFALGESEVSIKILDNTGKTQNLNFYFIHEPSLLAKGKSVFSYNIGFPSRDIFHNSSQTKNLPGLEVLNYKYDLDHPMLFLSYRRGLGEQISAEGYSQLQDTAGVLGLGILKALKVGKVQASAAGSYQSNRSLGYAGKMEYTYIPKITSKVSPISWRLKSEYLSQTFFRPSQDASLLGALTFDASIQKTSNFANLNLGGSYSFRPDSINFFSINASLSRGWGKGWSTTLLLRNILDKSRKTNTSVAANLNYGFSFENQNLNASQSVNNHTPELTDRGNPPSWDNSTNLRWDYNASSPFPENPSLGVTTDFGPSGNDYNGNIEWKGNQGIAQVTGRRHEPKLSSVITNYADLNLQTSFVFAGGDFALSRPITNSFVMVKGIENMRSRDLLVNANERGYDAMGQPWLPGVIPYIWPYSLKKIHIDVVDPPFGSNEERADYTIFPGYKSGYVFSMGTKATIIALGTLLLPDGKAAEYQPFLASPMDGESREPISGFTNAVGKFQLSRLVPGKYKISLDVNGKPYSTLLNLPKKYEGLTSIGVLKLMEEERKSTPP